MDEKAKKYTRLFRQVKIASAATVDASGRPHTRVINVMIANDDGMYIVTSRGKPFHRQLVTTGEIALSASCPNHQSLKFLGRCRVVSAEFLHQVFRDNPGMNEVYPGASRDILDCFLIYEGHGEWFDLARHPITRETFAYGGDQEERAGFEILQGCIACGICAEACPQQCIEPGNIYRINGAHCLHCGLCIEKCPVGAVHRLHP